MNAGTFSLTGVHVRYNQGRGIWVPSTSASHFTITGCKIYGNNQGINLPSSQATKGGELSSTSPAYTIGNRANDAQATPLIATMAGNIVHGNGVTSALPAVGEIETFAVVGNVCLDADAGVC